MSNSISSPLIFARTSNVSLKMKPLIVLIIAFTLAVFGTRIFLPFYDFALAARIAMAAMLGFTAIGHFAFPKGMTMMIPTAIPAKLALVYLTGVIEIAGGAGLLIPQTQVLAGWLLILFFILILPANISAALRGVDYQKGTLGGPGARYLWFRVPLQLLFIGWVYFSAVSPISL